MKALLGLVVCYFLVIFLTRYINKSKLFYGLVLLFGALLQVGIVLFYMFTLEVPTP
ncbi:MAG: hypothetical protein K9N57_00145 [Candidatus Marinimicrobia bacterium]|nr:hypothetical protein [Candidatus Neomarinimicrobiota bacterium]